jgi:hypothetical protein
MEQRETHDEVADQGERAADDLEEQTDRLGDEIHRAREDWESKLSSSDTPGATKPEAAAPGGFGADEDEDENEERDEEGGSP